MDTLRTEQGRPRTEVSQWVANEAERFRLMLTLCVAAAPTDVLEARDAETLRKEIVNALFKSLYRDRARVPVKPYRNFPLTVHPNGQWSKVVNKKPYYFGSWRTDPTGDAALKRWLEMKDTLQVTARIAAEVAQIPDPAEVTVDQVVSRYLAVRGSDIANHVIMPDTFRDYRHALTDFARCVGGGTTAAELRPAHFAIWRDALDRRKLGPHAIKRNIRAIRTCFKYATEAEWMPAVRFGPAMKAPKTEPEAVVLHHARQGTESKTERVVTRREVRKLLRKVRDDPKWKAVILLMLNTAMNPAEIARLKWSEINFKTGRLSRRRMKTGIRQEAYLWKRTRRALKAFVSASDLVFTRKNGKTLVGSEPVMEGAVIKRVSRWNKIIGPFADIAKAAGLDGVTPYTLRRSIRTLAAHCPDDNAAKRMMGQRLAGRDQTYLKGKFPLKRLKRISHVINSRLFRKANLNKPETA